MVSVHDSNWLETSLCDYKNHVRKQHSERFSCAVVPGKGRVLISNVEISAGCEVLREPFLHHSTCDLKTKNYFIQKLTKWTEKEDYDLEPCWYWGALCTWLIEEDVQSLIQSVSEMPTNSALFLTFSNIVDTIRHMQIPTVSLEVFSRFSLFFTPPKCPVSKETNSVLTHIEVLLRIRSKFGCRTPSLLPTFRSMATSDPEKRICSILEKLFDRERFERILQCWVLNCFELSTDPPGLITFFTPTLCSHSCLPNALWVLDPNTKEMTLIARRAIKPGDEILISYLEEEVLYRPTSMRRNALEVSKQFTCGCAWCSAPLDRARGFRCPSCSRGTVFLDPNISLGRESVPCSSPFSEVATDDHGLSDDWLDFDTFRFQMVGNSPNEDRDLVMESCICDLVFKCPKPYCSNWMTTNLLEENKHLNSSDCDGEIKKRLNVEVLRCTDLQSYLSLGDDNREIRNNIKNNLKILKSGVCLECGHRLTEREERNLVQNEKAAWTILKRMRKEVLPEVATADSDVCSSSDSDNDDDENQGLEMMGGRSLNIFPPNLQLKEIQNDSNYLDSEKSESIKQTESISSFENSSSDDTAVLLSPQPVSSPLNTQTRTGGSSEHSISGSQTTPSDRRKRFQVLQKNSFCSSAKQPHRSSELLCEYLSTMTQHYCWLAASELLAAFHSNYKRHEMALEYCRLRYFLIQRMYPILTSTLATASEYIADFLCAVCGWMDPLSLDRQIEPCVVQRVLATSEIEERWNESLAIMRLLFGDSKENYSELESKLTNLYKLKELNFENVNHE